MRAAPFDPAAKRRGADRFGRLAETLCAWRLRLAGYRIIARRYRSPVGEIDLVAIRGGTVAFIEVKARSGRAEAMEALDGRQRRRIMRAASLYLSQHQALGGAAARFDVMVVVPWPHLRCLWPLHLVDAWRPGLE